MFQVIFNHRIDMPMWTNNVLLIIKWIETNTRPTEHMYSRNKCVACEHRAHTDSHTHMQREKKDKFSSCHCNRWKYPLRSSLLCVNTEQKRFQFANAVCMCNSETRIQLIFFVSRFQKFTKKKPYFPLKLRMQKIPAVI